MKFYYLKHKTKDLFVGRKFTRHAYLFKTVKEQLSFLEGTPIIVQNKSKILCRISNTNILIKNELELKEVVL